MAAFVTNMNADLAERNIHKRYAILRIYVADEHMREQYSEHIQRHNESIVDNPFPNAGFDILMPETFRIVPDLNSVFLNLRVKGEMTLCEGTESAPTSYYTYPRSSFSKTPLVLANHVGIIDAGYRGFLISAVRHIGLSEYVAEQGTRLFQICHPSLCPIYVFMVDDEGQLSSTERGAGGFGSTGR